MSIIYHVMSRGVDKRVIFQDDHDYLRFIHDLFEFNDTKPADKFGLAKSDATSDFASPNFHKPRELLVTLHAFCLMPNHYHLLISPIKEDGLLRFIRKLNIGYAKYFNQRYERKGTLFESRYKSILVEREEHLLHLPYYIHCNPLDLTAPEWRERSLANPKQAWQFLEHYRWSSHPDYLGNKNFPSVTQRDFLLEFFGGTDGYRDALQKWLENMDSTPPHEIILE